MYFKRFFYTLILIMISISSSLFAGTWKTENNSGFFGFREYAVYIPDNLPKTKKPSLVVMLHGCDQNVEEFAAGTRITKFADKEKFIVLLPEQNTTYNSFKCWNWVVPSNNTRSGEAQSIISMLDSVAEKYDINTQSVYAVGMSAGASMVSILGNCFPEHFRALGVQDGTQYFATATGLDFINVVLKGASIDFDLAAEVGNACSAGVSNRPTQMPMIIFNGKNSPQMSPIHALQVESEMLAFNDYLDNGIRDNSYFLSKKMITVPEGKTYGYDLYTTMSTANTPLIERYMVEKLGHDWSGGLAGLPFNDPKGPDATGMMIRFFKKFGL